MVCDTKLFQNLLDHKLDKVRQCTFKNVGLNLHLKLFNFKQGSLGELVKQEDRCSCTGYHLLDLSLTESAAFTHIFIRYRFTSALH